MGVFRLAACRCALVALPALGAFASPALAAPPPVPSLEPAATQRLWSELVHQPRTLAAPADTACRPLRAVFYAQTDWLRLATALAANPSPCADYYVSVPPLTGDKTALRNGQASRIRALGPQFHALAEIHMTAWGRWVASSGGSWFDAGVEARRRMDAAGFDVSAGDTWAVNELSSAVRRGDGTARTAVRDFLRGLYTGDGNHPTKGVVFTIGVGQATSALTAYKAALQSWYLDAPFWQEISTYVSDWSQEVYGDVRAEAVLGAPLATRVEYLSDFLGHGLTLANVGPPEAADARTFLQQAYEPLANAAWAWSSSFGWTAVPVGLMEDYVSTEVAALRSFDAAAGLPGDRFGFAWAPRTADGSAWTPQFTADSRALLDRLAAAIHDSGSAPEAACGDTWCTGGLEGAAFLDSWKTFAAWSPTAIAFAAGPVTVAAGAVSPPITLELQAVSVPAPATAPATVTLSSSSPTGLFAAAPSGPWSSTLALTVPAGVSTASFYFLDATQGSPTISATAPGLAGATQTETVTPATAAPDLAVSLVADAQTAPAPGAALTYTATVASANGVGSSAARLDLALPVGFAVTQATADAGPGCTTAGQAVTCDLGPVAAGGETHVVVAGTVGSAGEQDATATVTSLAEPDANPANNVATLALAPQAARQTARTKPRAVRAPKIRGAARVGRRLQVVRPAWRWRPSRVRYQWQVCSGGRCRPLRGATALHLKVGPGLAHRRVRVVAVATFGHTRVSSASRSVAVRPARA